MTRSNYLTVRHKPIKSAQQINAMVGGNQVQFFGERKGCHFGSSLQGHIISLIKALIWVHESGTLKWTPVILELFLCLTDER